ncbi:MAG: hydrogenase maturation nickel metallochaperone HypA [Cyanobacteria bacterium NC_groundwater_1444_Ag_S-0.65um_54_12]|nr:hydrogenase maturation nickel metallochaperone HypA [Cyanobacteria bacterium NC_groundwater_1444_Ag_S-0.65um_54_12]
MTTIEKQAEQHGFSQVRTVRLNIGMLAPVASEALRNCFEIASQGTMAAGAVLAIERIPARGWCATCATPVTVQDYFEACPRCGRPELITTGGDELSIAELEVD